MIKPNHVIIVQEVSPGCGPIGDVELLQIPLAEFKKLEKLKAEDEGGEMDDFDVRLEKILDTATVVSHMAFIDVNDTIYD